MGSDAYKNFIKSCWLHKRVLPQNICQTGKYQLQNLQSDEVITVHTNTVRCFSCLFFFFYQFFIFVFARRATFDQLILIIFSEEAAFSPFLITSRCCGCQQSVITVWISIKGISQELHQPICF